MRQELPLLDQDLVIPGAGFDPNIPVKWVGLSLNPPLQMYTILFTILKMRQELPLLDQDLEQYPNVLAEIVGVGE